MQGQHHPMDTEVAKFFDPNSRGCYANLDELIATPLNTENCSENLRDLSDLRVMLVMLSAQLRFAS
jgi:hypothetical protein